MRKRVYQLRRIIAVIALSAIFCVGCGNKSAEMQPETNLQGEMPEEPQGTGGQEEDLAESIPEADAESAQTALDDEKEAEEDLEAKDSSLEMQSFPKPWGELIEGKAPIVSITRDGREWSTQDGKYVLYKTYQDIVTVENEGFENLQAALAEYFSPIDEEEHEIFLRYAQEAYDDFDEEKENYFINYYSWQSVELERSDSTVISFDESCSIHTGGVHPYGGCLGVTFDVKTGRKLELADILKDEAGFYKAAVDYLTDWLVRNFGEKSFGQEKRNYVAHTFDEDRTVNWYLNGAGIVIIYNPYEIEAYSAGVIEITLPYGLFYEYIREEYTNPHTELIAAVPEGEDIAGLLGLEQLVEITSDGPGDGFVYVTINDMNERAGVGRFGDAYVIKRQNGRIFLVFVVLEEDVDTMCVYEITDGEIKKCDEKTEAYFDSSFWGTERIGISLTVHALGTHTGYMDFKWDEKGKLVAAEEIYEIKAAWNLIVIKDIPVRMEGVETVVKAGEQIMVTGINMEENIYYFQVVDSGECGEIYYNESQKGRMIDGISEFEYFENLNYAG